MSPLMVRILFVVWLLLPTFPLLSQIGSFSSPEAKRDSALAHDLLERAQFHFDSAQTDAAISAAREAVRLLRLYLNDADPRLADAFSMLGLGLVRDAQTRAEAFDFWQKVEKMPQITDPLSRANAHYFVGTCHLYSGQLDRMEQEYRKALDLYSAQPGRLHGNTGRVYNNFGYVATVQGQIETAMDWHEKTIAFWHNHSGPRSAMLASPYNNRGLIYWNQGRYDDALADYRAALDIRTHTLPPGHRDIGATLLNTGLILHEKGSLDVAGNYFMQALGIFQQVKDSTAISKAVNNLGMIRNRQLDYENARRYYLQALALEQAAKKPDTLEIAVSHLNIGTTYRDEGKSDSAIVFFRRALELAAPGHPQTAQFLNAIGTAYEQQRQFQLALDYYNRAEQQATNDRYDNRHPFFALLLFNKANAYRGLGDLATALSFNREASRNLGYDDDRKFDKVPFMSYLCSVLAQQSQLLYQDAVAKGDSGGMLRARSAALDALFAYQQFSRVPREPSVRLLTRAAAFSTAEVAIAANHRLFRHALDTAFWRDAFQHAEQTKAFLLLEAIRAANVLESSTADTSLLRRERELREALARQDVRVQERLSQVANTADSVLIQLTLDRASLYEQHDSLVRIVTDARDGRLNPRAISVQAIQDSLLQPGQTLLEYTVGDSAIFAFVIRPDHFSVHELPRDFPLEQTVDSLTRLGMYAYYTLPKDKRSPALEKTSVRNYTNAARLLYDKLVAPIADYLTEDLVVVPDGVLGYVPFEALLSGEPARRGVFSTYEPHFLLNRHRISYSASATLLREMRDKRHRHEPQASVLALAPFFREDTSAMHARVDSADPFALRDAFGPLSASGGEVYAVANLLAGSALYGPDASLDAFRQRAPQHRILHLSTHGKADDRLGDYAYLALGVPGDTTSFEKLYARDLYGIGLNADLVVLSACETATGKLRRGEGIVSLARAFSFAGAKSLVTTLWKVDDTATKDLMTGFYRHLRDGKTKDTALRQAKLDFLENNRAVDGGAKLHPFFWAGFVAIGDMHALH